MGIEAAIVGSAIIGAASSSMTQAANASAQSKLNRETMDFNHKEAELAREWQSQQDAINRIFNANQSSAQRSWASNEALKLNQFNAEEAQKNRSFQAKEAVKARSFDAQQSLLARQFEERMSSSAHQREMADLKAAGLNPILTATGGSGASTPSVPVVGSPMPSGSSASGSLPSGSSASGVSGHGAAAMVSGLNAYMKKDVVGQFINSALDGIRTTNDLKRAQAQDKEAQAAMLNAQTNAKRQAQDALESMQRISNIKSDTKLKDFQALSQEKQVQLYAEKIISEIRERTDKHNLSEAQQKAVMISANAAATAASAQAHMASIQDRIQTAESPERINKLQKEANYWQSMFDKNKWIMEDPKIIMQREWWKNNEGAIGVKEAADIIGDVFRGGMIIPVK